MSHNVVTEVGFGNVPSERNSATDFTFILKGVGWCLV